MSEMITIEQEDYNRITVEPPIENILVITQDEPEEGEQIINLEANAVAPLIKLHPDCRDEVSKGINTTPIGIDR